MSLQRDNARMGRVGTSLRLAEHLTSPPPEKTDGRESHPTDYGPAKVRARLDDNSALVIIEDLS